MHSLSQVNFLESSKNGKKPKFNKHLGVVTLKTPYFRVKANSFQLDAVVLIWSLKMPFFFSQVNSK